MAKRKANVTHIAKPTGSESKPKQLTSEELGRLLIASGVPVTTIRKWWSGEDVKPVTRSALEQAARRTRLPVPDRCRRPRPNTSNTSIVD
jgi:hypothetical protein